MMKKVTVVVGNPIKLDSILEDLQQRDASDEERRRVVTDVVQASLYKLRVVSEVLHARHLSSGWFSRPLPDFTLEP
jgi:hypothetical protein